MRSLILVESNTSGTGPLFARMAAQLGFRPVLLTADASRYGFVEKEGLAVVRVDTQDRAALLDACRRLAKETAGIAGVTSSSEYFISTAAGLAREFGLPGPDPEAVEACRDKGFQRLRLREAGVGVPEFRIVHSLDEAAEAAAALGLPRLPVVVKPVLGTGSMQVRLCRDRAEVLAAAGAILERRHNERGMPLPARLLVESLAVGPEFSVESFGPRILGVTRKHLGALPYFVEVGHDFPAPLPAAQERAIRDAASRTLEALGLHWGPTHIELKLTDEGPVIIEVNPRLAGGFIPELVRLATGVDMILQTVRAASGSAPELEPTTESCSSIRFLIPPGEGILAAVEGLEEARALPGVVAVELYTEPGREVFLRGDFRDRVGHAIARSGSVAESARAAERARDAVRLVAGA